MAGYCGSLPSEFTVGGHCGSLPLEVTAGVYHGRSVYHWGLPQEFTVGGASLFVFGYHWLPIATIDLVGDNREFEV